MPRPLALISFMLVFIISSNTSRGNEPDLYPTWAKNIQGIFEGYLLSGDEKSEVTTAFMISADDEIFGTYTFLDNAANERGSLSNCQAGPNLELQCQWQDYYGQGELVIKFNKSFDSFRGFWGPEGEEPSLFWDGKRQFY